MSHRACCHAFKVQAYGEAMWIRYSGERARAFITNLLVGGRGGCARYEALRGVVLLLISGACLGSVTASKIIILRRHSCVCPEFIIIDDPPAVISGRGRQTRIQLLVRWGFKGHEVREARLLGFGVKAPLSKVFLEIHV